MNIEVEETVEIKQKKRKKSIYQYPNLQQDLKQIFGSKNRIESSDELLELFSEITSLPKPFSVKALQQTLKSDGILEYSRTEPKGYSLNLEKLREKYETWKDLPIEIPKSTKPSPDQIKTIKPKKAISVDKEKTQKKPIKQDDKPARKVREKKAAVNELKSKDSKPAKKDSTEISKIERKKAISTQETKSAEKKAADEAAAIKSKGYKRGIPKFPKKMLNKMSGKAKQYLYTDSRKLDKLSLNILLKMQEALSVAQVCYDQDYSKERAVLEAIRYKYRLVTEQVEKKREELAEEMLDKLVYSQLEHGKLSGIIKKWGVKYSSDICLVKIMRKLGGKKKKIPLSEYAIRNRIKEFILKKYPEKSRF